MTGRLTFSAPATLTVLAGNASLSSLEGAALGLAPGMALSGAGAADNVTLQVVAGNTGALLGVSAAGGATVSAQLNTLSLSGTQAQVNAALAGLELTEPGSVSADVLSFSATDTAAVAVAGGLAVNVVAAVGPAFVAPPQIVTLNANALSPLPGLVLADPIAAGLAAMGLGREETLSLTLSVAQGVLLLPGITALNGISASGLGSGTIVLSCTADEIGVLNSLLAGLEFAGPSIPGGQHLDYALWNASGVLPRVVTYGAIYLNTVGPAAGNGVYAAGAQTLITGGTMFSGTLSVAGTDTVLGMLAGGTIEIAPGAMLELPDDSMSLSGSSADFGSLTAQQLTLAGSLLVGGAASFANQVALLPGALLDIANGLTVYGTANNSFDVGLNLGAGAVVQGNGTITVGNFSQSGVVTGGTLEALGGATLELDASWITAGAVVEAAGGGVMVLGPVSPLYGIFNTTPLTIDSGVTLSFLGPGAQAITGGYADTLGGTGGAFVIAGPQYFSGTVTGFGVGDELIFPDLANMSIYNVGLNSFQMAGLNVFGGTETYTIHTSIANGLAPSAGLDAQGDQVVFMRSTLATVTQGAALSATPGTAQPLLGASVDLTGTGTLGLTITLSAQRGSLSSNGGAASSRITLTAANIAALNAEIQAVNYYGTGIPDSVVFSSNAGVLAGVQGGLIIGAGVAGTVSGYSGLGATAAEWVSFGLAVGLPVISQPLVAGGIQVSGAATFEDIISTRGYSGTGLLADAGGNAIFGATATVSLAGDVTLGDAAGAGTLTVLADHFTAAGNVTLAAAAAGVGSEAAVLGMMTVAGALDIGVAAAATLQVLGSLAGTAVTIGTSGTVEALGTAQLGLGTVTNGGNFLAAGAAVVHAAAYQGNGALELGGTATLSITGLALASNGGGPVPSISIGAGAVLEAGSMALGNGDVALAGLITTPGTILLGSINLSGGTVVAPAILAGGTVAGFGVLASPSLTNTGLLEAVGGRLLLTGSLNNAALAEVASGAVLEIGGTAGGAAVTFAGAGGALVLDDARAGNFSVAQMQAGDVVDLVGVAPGLVSLGGGGAGWILDSQGTAMVQFAVQAPGTLQPNISVTSDGAGGALLTIGGVMPCFARGTGILSPHGYRPVESLRPNDPVITANGERRPVRWIGWRTLDLGPDAARQARPILVLPHAFGPGRPSRMLRLSPSHCVLADGVLIPITHLVNGATVRREAAAQAVTYFHVELDRHDILLAEGLECESYFDDGNRAAMYQELGRRCPARRAVAPVVTSGARLAAVRRTLHERALAAGFAAQFWPVLRAVAAGMTVLPAILPAKAGRVARFSFNAPVKDMVLLAATSCPADTDPGSEDRRELGVCLGAMRGVRFGAGWQVPAAGDAGTWMSARAELGFTRARREISLPLAAVAQSWRRGPAFGGVEGTVDGARGGG